MKYSVHQAVTNEENVSIPMEDSSLKILILQRFEFCIIKVSQYGVMAEISSMPSQSSHNCQGDDEPVQTRALHDYMTYLMRGSRVQARFFVHI